MIVRHSSFENMRGNTMKKVLSTALLLTIACLYGCEPEVGSKAWCEAMDKKPKGDWTANEAAEYAKSCVFRSDD